MGRVDLDLGAPPEGKSITERLEAYKTGAQDPHLEALIFQYGRYLLISSSRGFLPANLQGLWNDRNKPAWFSDYHTNINLQMNYWLAEPSNLSECALPLFDWTVAMIPGSREATVKEFGEKTPGWTMRTSVNIFGGNGWQWNLPASAWLAQHFWDHYAFTGDKDFLTKTAWPVFAGCFRILARSPHRKGRQTGRPQRLVAGARPARGRRGPRPADRLGPLHQHARSRQGPWPEKRPVGRAESPPPAKGC